MNNSERLRNLEITMKVAKEELDDKPLVDELQEMISSLELTIDSERRLCQREAEKYEDKYLMTKYGDSIRLYKINSIIDASNNYFQSKTDMIVISSDYCDNEKYYQISYIPNISRMIFYNEIVQITEAIYNDILVGDLKILNIKRNTLSNLYDNWINLKGAVE